MNILCIGDIFGEPGRRAVETWLSRLIDQHGIDFVIANVDNTGPKMSSPFQAADALLKEIGNQTKIILVDLHAEATAEKRALAWYLDGRVTCVVGTHTHVQTCDEEILPRGTAYISDLGMTGPHRSVVGLDIEIAIKRFLSQGEFKGFKVAKEDVRLEGLLIDVDEESGRAISVNRIRKVL